MGGNVCGGFDSFLLDLYIGSNELSICLFVGRIFQDNTNLIFQVAEILGIPFLGQTSGDNSGKPKP